MMTRAIGNSDTFGQSDHRRLPGKTVNPPPDPIARAHRRRAQSQVNGDAAWRNPALQTISDRIQTGVLRPRGRRVER